MEGEENTQQIVEKDSGSSTKKNIKKDFETPSPFAELDKKSALPLVLYIASVLVLGTAVLIFSLNGGSHDFEWSKAIYSWGNTQELFIFLGTWGFLIIVVPLGIFFIIWILSFIPSMQPKTKPVLKYAGLFILTAFLGLLINRLLMGLSGRIAPDYSILTEGSIWYNFAPSQNNGWLEGSFTSFIMTLASVIIALPYCFNSKETKIWEIITAIVALAYMILMGLALVATSQNYLSDVIIAGVIQYWIAALVGKRILAVREQELLDIYDRVNLPVENAYRKILKAKSVLNYSEINYLLNKTQKMLIEEKSKAEDTKAKGKEVPYLEGLTEIISLIQESIEKIESDFAAISSILENCIQKFGEVTSLEKTSKIFGKTQPLIEDALSILADNKTYALNLLTESRELYQKGINAATNEPGDFQYVIDKAEVWINYVNRFESELQPLETTSGEDFEAYMKANFLYII